MQRACMHYFKELVLGIFGSGWREQENEREVMTDMVREDASGQFLQLQHGQTYCQLEGDTDGTLLICIHGWSTASYVWKPLKPFLLAKGYRVLTYDLYGRGYSDRPDVSHSTELFTNQLTEILGQLGLSNTKLNIIGYSMGGAIATHFVSERLQDVERLLLIAPAGMAVRLPAMRFFARSMPRLFDSFILSKLANVLRNKFKDAAVDFQNDEAVQYVLEKQLNELNYQGYIPALLSSLKGALASRMSAEHRTIANSNVNVLAIFASGDKTIPHPTAKRRFDRWNRNNVSRKIKGAGHALTYTHARQIIDEVGDFL